MHEQAPYQPAFAVTVDVCLRGRELLAQRIVLKETGQEWHAALSIKVGDDTGVGCALFERELGVCRLRLQDQHAMAALLCVLQALDRDVFIGSIEMRKIFVAEVGAEQLAGQRADGDQPVAMLAWFVQHRFRLSGRGT